MGRGEKRRADAGVGHARQQPQGVVAVRKRPFLPRRDRPARAARQRLSLLHEPEGSAGVQRSCDRSAAHCQTVATPTLNGGLTPEMVTAGSNRKVWWQCPLGHTWKAVVYSRAGSQRCGCPICAGKGKRKMCGTRKSSQSPQNPPQPKERRTCSGYENRPHEAHSRQIKHVPPQAGFT